jgi:non-ribosomal peptide synthetase component F
VCKLLSMASSCGATLFMTLMATWQLLLARYSRMEDVITLTTVANNLKRPDLDDVLGPFSNLVALRIDLSGEQPPTFFSLVRPCSIFLSQDLIGIRGILKPMPNVLTAAACRRTNFQTAAWQGEGGDTERAGTFGAALQGGPGRIVAERRRCQ